MRQSHREGTVCCSFLSERHSPTPCPHLISFHPRTFESRPLIHRQILFTCTIELHLSIEYHSLRAEKRSLSIIIVDYASTGCHTMRRLRHLPSLRLYALTTLEVSHNGKMPPCSPVAMLLPPAIKLAASCLRYTATWQTGAGPGFRGVPAACALVYMLCDL